MLRFILFLFPTVFFAISTCLAQTGSETDVAGSIVVGNRVLFTIRAAADGLDAADRAELANEQISRALNDDSLEPEKLTAVPLADGSNLLAIGKLQLLAVTASDAQWASATVDQLTESWLRILRQALIEAKPLSHHGKHSGSSFKPLLIVAFLAFLVPVVLMQLPRLPFPVVVGEILMGVVVGHSGFDLIGYDSSLRFLAEFGFAYLMFLAGLEVDLDSMRSSADSDTPPVPTWRNRFVIIPAASLFLTFVMSGLISLGLTEAGMVKHPLFISLVISTTSLGLVVPILKDRGLIDSPYGQLLLISALLADFVTMFLITAVAGWISRGLTLELLLGLVILVVFAIAVKVGRKFIGSPQLVERFRQLRNSTSHIAIRGSLALMLAFVALAESLGSEVILGAFLAGVLVSLISSREDAGFRHRLEAIGFGFFIPIFFIMVGVRFDIRSLFSSPSGLVLTLILILSGIAIKIVAALPFRICFSWRETWAAGFLLSSRLSLVIAGAEIGVRLGLFPTAMYSAIVSLALVTCIIGPTVFCKLLGRSSTCPEILSARREDTLRLRF